MNKKNIIIVGVGKRVITDVLPAIEASGVFNVIGLYARKERKLSVNQNTYFIKPLNELSADLIINVDWIYLGVPSKQLSNVFKFLTSLPVQKIKLIMDTPVLPWRQTLSRNYFKYFSEVVVAEDAIYLPWIEPVKKLLGGTITKMVFDRSVYRYHGIALAKAIAGTNFFKKARMHNSSKNKIIELESDNNIKITIIEPRDYNNGTMHFYGPKGSVTDDKKDFSTIMKPMVTNGLCIGLLVGNIKVDFSPTEIKIIGPVQDDATITSLTLQLKRVSLLKIFKGLGEDKQIAWSVRNALADTYLDEKIHHFGQWFNVA